MTWKILVVDDDDMFRKMTSRILSSWGYSVYQASDGREAVLLCEALRPKIVLLDAILPNMDGFETCRHMKHSRHDSFQVIMVTGDSEPEAVNQAFAAGAIDFVPKPIHYPVLEHRLKRLIETQKAQEALKASEDKFRTLFSSVADAVFVIELDEEEQPGRIVEVNDQASLLLGYSKEELLQMNIEDLVHDFFGERIIVSNEKSLVKELVLATKSGQSVLVEVHRRTIELESQHVLLSVVRDLTERRQTEDDMRESIFLAATVQRSFLPKPLRNKKFSIETIYQPYDTVGGDLYNFRYFPEQQKLVGYLLDVTGHNVATAMRASALSALLWDVSSRNWSLSEKLTWVNQEVANFFSEDTFAAVIYFEVDLKQKKLDYVSGGVNYFFSHSQSLNSRVETPGLYLGILKETDFEDFSVPIEAGNSFYFMSDGLYELLENEVMQWSDFSSSVKNLKKLSKSNERLDDVTALCIHIGDGW